MLFCESVFAAVDKNTWKFEEINFEITKNADVISIDVEVDCENLIYYLANTVNT